ncbi:tripartite tricarboxylate transporter permease [Nonomuraea sp. NPDC050022]|uniref:tripartite tricarboxylate transporter permease n=1 Tax=Nonomuraea sp. NPDC050022 TaxID=3364358 RepID=UPI0037B535ED
MDILQNLADGLQVALAPQNLLFVLLGVSVGMMVGVLPGLGPAPTVALLLPITFGLEPSTAVIMLAGVYYGAMYGGTITSVLLRIPGEAASSPVRRSGSATASHRRCPARRPPTTPPASPASSRCSRSASRRTACSPSSSAHC